MWSLVTQSAANNAVFETEELSTYGAIVSKLLESSSVILKCIMNFVINGGTAITKEEVSGAMEAMFRSKLVGCLVESARTYGANLSPHCTANIVNVMCELVLSTTAFLKQFADAQGLEAIDDLPMGVFHPTRGGNTDASAAAGGSAAGGLDQYKLDAMISGLQISSQLARNSEKYYSSLISVFTAQKLIAMMTETNVAVVAKVCNLVGNLCRHSDRFYSTMCTMVKIKQANGKSVPRNMLDLLAWCCGHEDASIRKFASFAGKVHGFSIQQYN